VSAPLPERLEADVVVIGAGIAGLSVALGLPAGTRAHVLTKARLGAGGSTPWAQGGIAAAVGPDDSPRLHAADTLAVAGGVAEPSAVEILARGGPAAIAGLQQLGASFDRRGDGLALGREAAHSRSRIVHARDATGAEVLRTLAAAVGRAPHVTVFEGERACDLLFDQGRVRGVLTRTEEDGRARLHGARAVVLASGGIGQAWACTTNPPEATGDGLALAARAGARLADLEFMQFHPTALAVGADPCPLLTEALRGAGALLLDEDGSRFLRELHPDGELAPRDVVARGLFLHRRAGHGTFLDCRREPGARLAEAFPTVFAACQRFGLDPRQDLVPVQPAAHYHMGGVWVDGWGRSSLPGLWACGEVSSTGVHGANRLASNSLLEALVFGGRVARDLAGALRRRAAATLPAASAGQLAAARQRPDAGLAAEATVRLRRAMWEHVGLVRDEHGLRTALGEIARLERQLGHGRDDVHALLEVGRLVAAAALARRESRGSHFRSDFPHGDPAWQRRQLVEPARLTA